MTIELGPYFRKNLDFQQNYRNISISTKFMKISIIATIFGSSRFFSKLIKISIFVIIVDFVNSSIKISILFTVFRNLEFGEKLTKISIFIKIYKSLNSSQNFRKIAISVKFLKIVTLVHIFGKVSILNKITVTSRFS